MDRLELMGDFVRIVERGSFSAVARQARLSQPTLSKRIRYLEDALGVRLLQRNTQGVRLTEAGERYYQACKEILSELERVQSELIECGELRGILRLNFPVGLGQQHFTQIAVDFQKQHPTLRIAVELTDRVVDLVEEGVDVAIRMGGVANPSLVARGLGAVSHVLAASPDYLKEHPAPRTPAELSQHNYLYYWGEPKEQLETPEGQVEVEVHGSMDLNNSFALRVAVVAGLGIGRLARWVVEEDLVAGRLVVVLPGVGPPPDPVYAVHLPSRRPPEKVLAFIRFFGERVKDIPGWLPAKKLPVKI